MNPKWAHSSCQIFGTSTTLFRFFSSHISRLRQFSYLRDTRFCVVKARGLSRNASTGGTQAFKVARESCSPQSCPLEMNQLNSSRILLEAAALAEDGRDPYLKCSPLERAQPSWKAASNVCELLRSLWLLCLFVHENPTNPSAKYFAESWIFLVHRTGNYKHTGYVCTMQCGLFGEERYLMIRFGASNSVDCWDFLHETFQISCLLGSMDEP